MRVVPPSSWLRMHTRCEFSSGSLSRSVDQVNTPDRSSSKEPLYRTFRPEPLVLMSSTAERTVKGCAEQP